MGTLLTRLLGTGAIISSYWLSIYSNFVALSYFSIHQKAPPTPTTKTAGLLLVVHAENYATVRFTRRLISALEKLEMEQPFQRFSALT